MDIKAEKASIIKQFMQIDDINLIIAIKSLLNFAMYKEKTDDDTLNELVAKIAEVRNRGFQVLSVNNNELCVGKNGMVHGVTKIDKCIKL